MTINLDQEPIALWVAGLDASLSSLITFLDASSSIIYIMHTLYIIIICVLIGYHRLRGGILLNNNFDLITWPTDLCTNWLNR